MSFSSVETKRDVDLLGCEQSEIPKHGEQNTFQKVQISTRGRQVPQEFPADDVSKHGEHAATDVLSMHDLEVLPPADAIDRTATIHRCSWPYHGSRDRAGPQHDAGPYDASGRICNVLAVHYGSTGLLTACNHENSYQQRRQ
jgi:hypothetical protein